MKVSVWPMAEARAGARHGRLMGSCGLSWCSPPGIGFPACPRRLSEQVPPPAVGKLGGS
jgi:hypothetical protein